MTLPALSVDDRVVIIGTGQGGFQLAASLREGGFTGSIDLVGDEPHLPYQRPPLSKEYLAGDTDPAVTDLRGEEFYSGRSIKLHRGVRATAVDRERRRVALSTGEALDYDRLVFATGARPRPLPIDGADLTGVVALRTRDDADALRSHLAAGARIAIIGGGFIGLEIGAVARAGGHEVTVIEGLPRLMARASSPELAGFLLDEHQRHGSTMKLGAGVARITGEAGRATGVELSDGTRVEADIVLVAVGVVPNDELAAAAGLEAANGIVVDHSLATTDPRISAIGDCVSYPSVHAGGRARLESVQNAVDQARHVARTLIVGSAEGYANVPWFWSHQFGLNVQMAGIASPECTRVVLGSIADRRFSVYSFDDDRLVRIESVNDPATHLAARKVLAGDRRPTPAEVAEPDFHLKGFAA